MNNFTYCTPTRYVFGRNAEAETGRLAKEYLGDPKKVLVVSGGSSAKKSGLLDRVMKALHSAGIDTEEMEGIKPNPTDDRVYEGIALCRERGVDAVIGVGGGSVIDTAKAIALGVLYEGDFWDFYAGKLAPEKALPIGVVLTIPAAGSEGSGNSVITKLDGLHKISLRSDFALRPKFAVMNPELTYTLPAYQTACGIADMIAHIMERYFTPTKNVEVTDGISEGLLRSIIAVAPRVFANPRDYDARANIMWAGTMAHNGICGCGRTEDWVSHFMEHEISAVYGVAHGAGLAVVFPAWMTYMTEVAPERPARFAREVMGVPATFDDKSDALAGIGRLKAFYHSIGLPVTLGELGVENPDFDLLVKKLHEDKGEIIGGYHKLDAEATEKIYKLML
ncbi:MAG: iron-containing alcohol dehydrogenase [Muribaculaceae bacterium]|nr:iron-containing alcohol dehydrogenase [Muribaculaceae bacterium]